VQGGKERGGQLILPEKKKLGDTVSVERKETNHDLTHGKGKRKTDRSSLWESGEKKKLTSTWGGGKKRG